MPDRLFRRRVRISYFAPFVAMALLAIVLLWGILNQVSITQRVEHSDQVLLLAKDAEAELRGMQSALSEALLLPDDGARPDDLQERQRGLQDNITRIATLVADNPAQERRLLEISDLKGQYVVAIEGALAGGRGRPPNNETLEMSRQLGRRLLQSLDAFVASEDQLRSARMAHQVRQARLLVVLAPLLAVITALLLSLWGWGVIRSASRQYADALNRSERASRAKDNFLGTISHELRNPLNSIILWCATLLSDDSLGEKTRRGLSAIDRASKAQAQLIEDLLDVSRIEGGRMRLDVQPVDLVEVVKAGIDGMRAAADAKSIQLQEIIDPRVPPIAGDPHRLQQVIWNLISNAVKFTPKQGKIQVRVERINSHVEITVADNGEGIDPAELPYVFDRFWQAEGSVREHGIGLGLTIVKEIVALHGGSAVAHSEGRGKGTTVTIRLPLPLSTASAAPRRHPTVTPLASLQGAPRLDGILILGVDDDPEACESLENLLASLGASVTTATSAEAALAMLERLEPDVVVSDLDMPVRDGYFLASQLRERERNRAGSRRVPLVALTAYGRVEDKVRTLATGFDAHVIKPVDPAELAATLRNLIAARTM